MSDQTKIAERFGLTLCDACEQPREIHVGYDHGNGRCLLDTTGMMLQLDGRHDKADLIKRLNAFFRAVDDAEEAERLIGAGI